MKLSMLKLLTILALLSNLSLFAAAEKKESSDQKVLAFLEQALSSNENYTLEKATIVKKEPLKEIAGWTVYFVRIDLKLKDGSKTVSLSDVVFSDGVLFSKDFTALGNKRSIYNKVKCNTWFRWKYHEWH